MQIVELSVMDDCYTKFHLYYIKLKSTKTIKGNYCKGSVSCYRGLALQNSVSRMRHVLTIVFPNFILWIPLSNLNIKVYRVKIFYQVLHVQSIRSHKTGTTLVVFDYEKMYFEITV